MNNSLLNTIMNKLKNIQHPDFKGIKLLNANELLYIENALRDLENVDLSKKLSELEAKVFTYEEIIKKSNFAPMLKVEENEGE